MSQISDIRNPWRDILLREPASFRNVIFHVEDIGKSSGRRIVVHEYPKRSNALGPYAEDMGLHARRFNISGYLVYRPSNPVYDYVGQRQRLNDALEKEDSGRLIHPVMAPGGMMVACERFTMTETRDRGGYTKFDMMFVEAGNPVSAIGFINPLADVATKAQSLETAAVALINTISGLL